MRSEVSRSKLEAGKRVGQDEGSPSLGEGDVWEGCRSPGAWTKEGRLLLANYTSTGDHRGQVTSKMAQKYRREGFKEKGLDCGPSPEQRWVYLRKRLADGNWGSAKSLGTGWGCKTTV